LLGGLLKDTRFFFNKPATPLVVHLEEQ
jgi:hypothetical protein